MSRAVRLRHVGVAFSDRGTPSIQIGPVGRDGFVIDRAFVAATDRHDIRRIVRALEALAVDLPESVGP